MVGLALATETNDIGDRGAAALANALKLMRTNFSMTINPVHGSTELGSDIMLFMNPISAVCMGAISYWAQGADTHQHRSSHHDTKWQTHLRPFSLAGRYCAPEDSIDGALPSAIQMPTAHHTARLQTSHSKRAQAATNIATTAARKAQS